MKPSLSDKSVYRISSRMKNAVSDETIFARFDFAKEMLGADALIDEIVMSMDINEAEETISFIERMHDLPNVLEEDL